MTTTSKQNERVQSLVRAADLGDVDRRTFLIRHAVIGAAAAMTGTT